MLTGEFREGVERLLEVARQKRTAILCAEGLFWRCHRRQDTDFMLANGVAVEHIMPAGELRPHTLTSGAVIEGGQVTYPAKGRSSPEQMIWPRPPPAASPPLGHHPYRLSSRPNTGRRLPALNGLFPTAQRPP